MEPDNNLIPPPPMEPRRRDLDWSDVEADARDARQAEFDREVRMLEANPLARRERIRRVPVADAILVVTLLEAADHTTLCHDVDCDDVDPVVLYDAAIGLGRDELATQITYLGGDDGRPTWEEYHDSLMDLACGYLASL